MPPRGHRVAWADDGSPLCTRLVEDSDNQWERCNPADVARAAAAAASDRGARGGVVQRSGAR